MAIPQKHGDQGREDAIPREESDSQEARNREYKYLVDPEAEARVRRPHSREAGDKERPEDPSRTPREGQQDPPVERARPNATTDARNERIRTPGRDPERAAPRGKGRGLPEKGRQVFHQDRPQIPSRSPPAKPERGV